MSLARFLDVTTSTAASAARPNFGNFHCERRKVPEQPLELYEFEVCPYCRIAREALSALSLDPIIYPCPRGGARFREKVKRDGGRYQFPYLVDRTSSHTSSASTATGTRHGSCASARSR